MSDSLLFRHQLGHIEPGVYPLGFETGEVHGPDGSSWQRVWELAGEETNLKWKCGLTMGDTEERRLSGGMRDGAWEEQIDRIYNHTGMRRTSQQDKFAFYELDFLNRAVTTNENLALLHGVSSAFSIRCSTFVLQDEPQVPAH